MAGFLSCLTFVSIRHFIPLYSPHYELQHPKIDTKLLFYLFSLFLLILFILPLEDLQYFTTTNYLIIITIVIVAAILDSLYMVIPDRLLLIFLPSIIFLQLLNNEFISGLLGGLFAFALLLLIAIISKGGIGGGDIKLVTVIGLGTSFTFVYQLLLLSSLLAFFIGLFNRVIGKRKKQEMAPFGPAISYTTVLLILYYSAQGGIV
ncbi:prepilin peptidase [Aquisalibacillus elongatus]|uniref:prepilin peptidase n=1 Tax=Aquisalibacillus elongatus TaxID=485577 RepID=UPI001476766F|nr:prepilin peptidase [Aquisalibacillus elongatus]